MKKYKCKICSRKLHINTYKARVIHINGYKHRLLKETKIMELYEDESVKNEIESHKKLFGSKFDLFFGKQNFGFKLPPVNFKKDFVIPPYPKNFSLPKYFDFSDIKNFPIDINEALQNILQSLNK